MYGKGTGVMPQRKVRPLIGPVVEELTWVGRNMGGFQNDSTTTGSIFSDRTSCQDYFRKLAQEM